MNYKETGPSSHPSVASNEPFRARGSQNETDPMRRVWDALGDGGYGPHGEPHSFRSRCPAHAGSNREALAVNEGIDGRVVMRCLVGCQTKAVLDVLELPWSALFRPGSRKAENQKPRPVKSLSAGAAFLDAMTVAGYRWHAQLLGVECPYCSDPNAYLAVHDAGGLEVCCPNDCGAQEVRRAVETRAAIAEKGVQL